MGRASQIDSRTSAYLERLSLPPEPPSLAALTRLHVRHLERIPFENLDIHRGVPIELDEDAILAKLSGGRGGFCYELNGAFAWLLRSLGYGVTLLSARVARKEGGYGIPFDHLVLRVELDADHLVDVGFGDSFVEPLPLVTGQVIIQGGERFRTRREGSEIVLERAAMGAEWAPQFAFTLTPRQLSDFEPGCRYHQISPQSSFTKGPICSRLDGGARITLHAERFTRAGRSTPVSGEDRWAELLEAHFGIVLGSASS